MPSMTKPDDRNRNTKRAGPSLDAWAVTLALVLALLIWSGVIKHIPW